MKIFVALFVLFYISQAVEVSKKPDGDINEKSERKFKSGKVQQLWEKANKMNIPSVTLSDLYLELKHHDHEWMELKVLKAQGEDEDGLQQAKLQKEFNGIMFKYGLAGINRDEVSPDKKAQKKNKELFQDRKLNRLWKEAQMSGKFTSAELDKLFLEFKHHEDKLTELYNLNAAAGYTETNAHPENGEISEQDRHSQMKELYEDVQDGYKRLHLMTKKSTDESVPFVEPRVLELWNMMKQGNFSEVEKRSLEEELRHFEKRIEKHRHFREQLKNAAEKVEYHEKQNEAAPERLSKHEKLQNKVLEMANIIHKTFTNLKSRLGPGVIKHKEL